MARQPITVQEPAESLSSHTGDRGRREARTLKQSTATFGVLVAAFAVSALYQIYRAMLMEIPEDAFTVTTGVIYVALVGVSALVLTDRRWAWWIVSTFALFLLSVGVFYYYPVVATARIMGPIAGWKAASIWAWSPSPSSSAC
jgi:hypothetical protein